MVPFIRKLLSRYPMLYRRAGDIYHRWIKFLDDRGAKKASSDVRIFDLDKRTLESLRLRDFQSQYGQDFILVEYNLIKNGGGVFLDLGANHPKQRSNTWYLDKYLDYTGLAVDALAYEIDWRERRPNTIFERAILTRNTGDKVEFATVNNKAGWEDALSGILLQQSGDSNGIGYTFTKSGKNIAYAVTSHIGVSVKEILNKYKINHADVAFLDVEGAEMLILQSIDWEKFSCPVFCIENRSDVSDPTPIRDFMRSRGYRLWGRVSICDDIFVKT